MKKKFGSDYPLLWTNLPRLNGMLIVANLSLFFVTHLVIEKGYYYTFYSLFFSGWSASPASSLMDCLIAFGSLVVLGLEGAGLYFLVTSGWYWVVTGRVPLSH